MKHMMKALALAAGLACAPVWAWGPGDSGGGEPPGPNATFEQGVQLQCLSPGDFWGEFAQMLNCGYIPWVNPPTEWIPKPSPPLPPIPEPGSAGLLLAGIGTLWFWLRGRKALTTGATPRKED